jgi:hypothetical protein
MQFYGISFLYPCKQSGRMQGLLVICLFISIFKCQAHPAIDQTAYMDTRKKYHKTANTSLPEDESLDVRKFSKTL